jgi:hypothetical protein
LHTTFTPKEQNVKFKPRAIMVIAATMLSASSASAQLLFRPTPDQIRYDFEAKVDPKARTCSLMAMIMRLDQPEAVNFRLIYGFKRPKTNPFMGFALDVGDLTYENSVPIGIKPTELTGGDITSRSFSSSNMDGGPVGDGGVIKIAQNKEAARQLVETVFSGSFSVNFSRQGGQTNTYIVTKPVPEEVLEKFAACTESS